MSGYAAATWSCPSCERRVPSREDVCHCGYDRRRTPAQGEQPVVQDLPGGAGMGRLLTALAGIVVAALVFVGVTTWRGSKPNSTRPGVEEEPSPNQAKKSPRMPE